VKSGGNSSDVQTSDDILFGVVSRKQSFEILGAKGIHEKVGEKPAGRMDRWGVSGTLAKGGV